ncbi:hypothetical protein HDU92_005910 [Lobulomyces angularis]|nr:hypothetical protein HDU92_005910 [Lobulomyces angularis]
MTDIDMEYFYLACTIPTQVGGIMGLIIIALNVIFLLVLFLLVAQLSKSVPADFRESKAFIISYLIFFILVCQTVAEYLKYSETIKTAIFGMLSALLFSVPTFFIVIPKLYLVLSSKSRKSTDPNKSSQSIGTVSTSFASLTLTPIKKLGNEVVMGNFAHLTPGLLGKWTRKVAYYDRKTNLFTLIPMVSLEIEERVLSCFQINGKNSKLVYKPTKKVEDKVGNMNFNNETLKKLEPNKNNVNEKGFAAHSDDESLFKETVEFMIICGGESHRVLLVDEDKEQIKLWKSLAEELSKSSNRAAVNISK